MAEDPAALKQVRQAVLKLDSAPQATANIHVRPLLYRRASDVANVLARTFGAEAPSAVWRAKPSGTLGNLSVASDASDRASLPVNVSASPAEMPDATVSTTDSADETVVSANLLAERFSSMCVGAQGSNEILGMHSMVSIMFGTQGKGGIAAALSAVS
ncbi:hypothetical protein [Mesorhizobium sp. LSHC414A00]|uniref:hypothetical protein n=1 Tax=Mesorhizobium sp. LSHC414A00 TaxID=1287287 RepID=UPI0003CDE292|nr:hypothetical protein [Mesorhizobium sp. LSHC414A00]ESX71821.1 hypothetical protein X757_21565 [Mesorhizobium sp. LSHC414A00]